MQCSRARHLRDEAKNRQPSREAEPSRWGCQTARLEPLYAALTIALVS
jgi:hypothetical protein